MTQRIETMLQNCLAYAHHVHRAPFAGAVDWQKKGLSPVLRSAPGIPVYHDQRVMLTMRQSIRHLKDGRYLIIFPEQPSGYRSHHMWINTGFLNVAPMFHKLTGKALRFYPVHISPRDRTFTVAKPICFDPSRTLEEQQEEIVAVLAPGLRGESVPSAE